MDLTNYSDKLLLDVAIYIVTVPDQDRDMMWAMMYAYFKSELLKREIW